MPASLYEAETTYVIPKTRWAKTIDDAYIAYQDFGEGPVTLVVIHGWITHVEVLWEQPRCARFMRRLAEWMRVLQFDKRGTGMSDRFARPPDLEARMDDVRAVMDTAGVERAALFGWGDGGPPLAAFFAAAHPERTVALCIDPHIHLRRAHDYPFEVAEEEFEEWLSHLTTIWGDEVPIFDDPPDAEYVRWEAKMSRYGATPGSMLALSRMWFETDVRDILPTIRVPTLVLSTDASWAGAEPAAYVAERIPGARIASITGRDPFVDDDPEPFVSAIESFLASIRQEEAEFGSRPRDRDVHRHRRIHRKDRGAGRPRMAGLDRATPLDRSRASRPLPRRGDGHRRRRVLLDVRLTRQGHPMRARHQRGGEAAGGRRAMRRAHG